MTPQEALNVLIQAGSQFRGTLQDHQNIQAALAVLKGLIEKETGK